METRIQITDRLRKAGLWSEACEFRNKVRLQAKAEGMSRREANQRAWTELASIYPPIPHEWIDISNAIQWWDERRFPIAENARNSDEGVWDGTCASVALLYVADSPVDYTIVLNELISDIAIESRYCDARTMVVIAVQNPLRFLKTKTTAHFEDTISYAKESEDVRHIIKFLDAVKKMSLNNATSVVKAELANPLDVACSVLE